MLVVGLTGGIGSGKTTVGRMLAKRGAVHVDADAISRQVVEPGTEGFAEVVESFGDEVVGPDGSLDRAKLASIVFADDERRKQLESIIHPRVGAGIGEALSAHKDTDAVVVLDVPLMAEAQGGSRRLAELIVVVTAPDDVRLDRLEARGVDQDDAKARMAAQVSEAERAKIADIVIDNSGTEADLEAQVADVWKTLRAKAGAR